MSENKIVPVDRARKEGKPMAAEEKKVVSAEKKANYVIIKDEKGNEYKLEFNARVVKNMERNGFKVDTDYPYTMIEKLFTGAFQMHHRGVLPERIMEIWHFQSPKDKLLGVLTQLYMKPLEDLMDDEKAEEENENPTWETF